MEVVTERRDISFWSLKQIPEALDALGRKAVAALGLRERWFHLEFFRLPDGSYVALEANLRPPGGFMTDMMNYACDIDVYRLWARARHGRSRERLPLHPQVPRVPHRPARGPRPTSTATRRWCARLGPTLMMHNPHLPSVYQAAMGTDMYLPATRTWSACTRTCASSRPRR